MGYENDILNREHEPFSEFEGARKTDKYPFAMRVDMSDSNYIYVGYALPGTQDLDAKWRIKRIPTATLSTLWADGDFKFDNVWTDHTSLNYI